ncbi:MAG: hypothetical protein JW963_16650 [Anaerolineales bacterium]|nr:hypothetical protein [Anaerolineales bacterium]
MKSMHKTSRVLVAVAAFLLLTLACSLSSTPGNTEEPVSVPSATVVVEPAASNTPRPTNTARPTSTSGPTDTPEPPSCYKWDQITLDMAGEVVCVYGVAFSHQGQSRIDFSPEKNSFFLIDTVYYYPNLSEGACVVAEEEVEVFDGKIPFMAINGKLYKCEPWMLE